MKYIFWVYLFLLGLAGIYFAWLTTSTYGAGVGTDGAIQLSTADNLLQGKGFIFYTGEAFVKWPPLYPLLLAGLSSLTRLGTFTAGWYLNVFLFGGIVWLGGALLFQFFRDQPAWAWIGSLALACSVSLLSICANIGTDPLFVIFCLAFLLAASRFLATGSSASLVGMAILGLLGSLQRLPGVTLIAAGVIFIIYHNRNNRWQSAGVALLFSTAISLPLSLWIIIHNYLQNNTLFGIDLFQATMPVENLQTSLVKILHWFVPYSLSGQRFSPFLLAVPVLFVVLTSRRTDWERLARRLADPAMRTSLIFAGLYLAFLILTENSVDTTYAYYDRYHLVIFVPVLGLVFTILQELFFGRVKGNRVITHLVTLLVFAAWLTYPVHNLVKYIDQSRVEGVITYNLYNTRRLQESKVVQVLLRLGQEQSQAIYSNYPAAGWFYTRRTVLETPRSVIAAEFSPAQVMETYQGWPWDRPGYLVWFLPNEYDHVLTPKYLKRLAELETIYKGADGEIYRLRARSK